MKRTGLFIVAVLVLKFTSLAQYSTPGSGVVWDLDDLVQESGGAVTLSDDGYAVHEDIFVISPDTIRIVDNAMVQFENDVLITVQGVWQTNPPDSLVFTAMDTLMPYKSFRFEDSDASVLKKCIIEYGGGVDVLDSDMLFSECIFRRNGKTNATGTIDLFHSSPHILHCDFISNSGPAVLSGANVECSPLIEGNMLFRNNTENTNMPQINLGTSHPDMPIRIIGNTIEGFYDKAGGIAVTTLAGGEISCVIDSNTIFNNRYGITAYGFDINSTITNNVIYDNNIENLPMVGGSGINFWGGVSNQSMVSGNTIYGNLWGITNTGDALPNLGQVEPDTLNPGQNKIYGNGNGGIEYNLYNNTPNEMYAQNNYWGTYNLDSVELVIFHYPDDETLGEVHYLPIMDTLVTRIVQSKRRHSLSVYPNPANNFLYVKPEQGTVKKKPCRVTVYDVSGNTLLKEEKRSDVFKLDTSELSPGVYFIEVWQGISISRSKFMKY